MGRGDRDREFEEFVAAAWPRLRRAAYLLSHDSHEAEDLVALVNGYIDSTRRRTPIPVDHAAYDADDRAAGPIDRADQRSELTALLAPLSPRERSIVVLRYYLDTSEQEVARELGVSVGTVKSTASRALARLRSAHATTTTQEHR